MSKHLKVTLIALMLVAALAACHYLDMQEE